MSGLRRTTDFEVEQAKQEPPPTRVESSSPEIGLKSDKQNTIVEDAIKEEEIEVNGTTPSVTYHYQCLVF